MLTGTNLKYARAHNLRIVLETIRLFGPLPRKDIAQRTELRLQTVSNITRKLLDADLILEVDRLQEGTLDVAQARVSYEKGARHRQQIRAVRRP